MEFFSRLEIVPIRSVPERLEMSIPGSKSLTNRALILAAHARGKVTLRGALWSQDTRVMVEALQALGYKVDVQRDADEVCNRVIIIDGLGGKVPPGGSPESPKEIFVANAGTAARFLVAMLCLGQGCYRISGVPRMHQRPQKALFESLRQLGYRIDSANDFLPAVVHGGGPRTGSVGVSVAESSQFASALLLSAAVGQWEVEITDGHPENLPYVNMTREMAAGFPMDGGDYFIEPDSSSASYFWAAAWMLGTGLRIRNWPSSDWQIDTRFPSFLPLPRTISRETDLGDSILTAIALAPFAGQETTFTDLGRLRVQECERVHAMREELGRLGIRVIEKGDTLTVFPAPESVHGAEIETYDDHRIAMSMALTGLKVPGVIIRDPGCIRKTFPNFFARWAAPPPDGLGGKLKDVETGLVIAPEELIVH